MEGRGVSGAFEWATGCGELRWAALRCEFGVEEGERVRMRLEAERRRSFVVCPRPFVG